jgi:methyl-accepting chemotaxis protein
MITGQINKLFSEIFRSVGVIVTQIQDVNGAAKEQKLGIDQISTAMVQIEKATQGSTSEAMQTQTLAGHLQDQSRKLREATNGLVKLVDGSSQKAAVQTTDVDDGAEVVEFKSTKKSPKENLRKAS